MTPIDAPDDDRTAVQPTIAPGRAGAPPAPAAPAATTTFQETELQLPPTQAVAPPAAPAAASPGAGEDLGEGLPVGTRLGEFEITALIGVGGFGIVYLATDHSLGRKVALKEYMPTALAARTGRAQVQVKSERYRDTFEAGLKSFVNEARLLASFDHPSLVRVYRFWEANGTAYMVMPYLQGKTLRDLLREQRAAGLPPPDEAWLRSVLGPLTEALMVIHAEQCYHRDIAPDNVMQLPNGRWLLLDFGAARRVISDMTQALTVILKPGYAPVEQYAEIPGMKQGAWTDVYALAAVVYYAITGKTPPPSVGRMLNDTYQPLAQVAAGQYDPGFLAAIDHALAVRPQERTQTIAELRQQLGLGMVAIDPYASSTLTMAPSTVAALRPSGAGMAGVPAAAPAAAPPAAQALAPSGELSGRPSGPASTALSGAPSAAPAAPGVGPAAARAPAAGSTAAAGPEPGHAGRKGGGMVGVGIGALVLAALGLGAVMLMSPGSKAPPPGPSDAPPALAPAATPPAAPPIATPPVATPPVATPPVATPPVAASPVADSPVAKSPAPGPPAPTAAGRAFDALRELERIVEQQTRDFVVLARAAKTTLKIGRDEFKFQVTSDRDGYLTLLGLGPDGTLAQLVPNRISGPMVRIRKGQTWRFPTGNGFYLQTQEPPGPTQLLVIVSERPRDFGALAMQVADPIRLFPAPAELARLAAAHAGSAPLLVGRARCPDSAVCSEAYGAALLRFDTVR
jgi:hypothetical protein